MPSRGTVLVLSRPAINAVNYAPSTKDSSGGDTRLVGRRVAGVPDIRVSVNAELLISPCLCRERWNARFHCPQWLRRFGVFKQLFPWIVLSHYHTSIPPTSASGNFRLHRSIRHTSKSSTIATMSSGLRSSRATSCVVFCLLWASLDS